MPEPCLSPASGELCITFLRGSYCPESTSDQGDVGAGVGSNTEIRQGGFSEVRWQILFF